MDFRNVLMAIVLSTLVLVGWATFFEAPVVEQQTAKNEVTKNEDLSSPSIDEDEKEIKNEITRSDVINNTNRIKYCQWENTDVLHAERNLPHIHHLKIMRLIIMEKEQDEAISA